MGAPAHGLLVAEVAGAVVGWAHVREEWSLEAGGRAELAGLVVDAERRGHGIGAQLVREAEAWARARGLPRIRVRTRIQREAARRFYGRLGYAESKIQAVLDKGLASLP
jgi:GNAT superfamily N-acetyltransferase